MEKLFQTDNGRWTAKETKWPLVAWIIVGGLFNRRDDPGKWLTAWGQIVLLLVVPGLYVLKRLSEVQDSPFASFVVDVLVVGSALFALILIWRGYREYSVIYDRNHVEYT